jgi:hypothetical protein
MATNFNGASPCFISIFPDTWALMRTEGAAWGTEVYASFAHEAAHCYQLSVWGSLAVFTGAPGFIAEGSIEYLGVEAVGYDADPGRWEQWFDPSGPQPSLLAPARSYDAIGWYSVVAQVQGSLWPKMAGPWRAYKTGGALAFIHALGGDTKAVETTLGPSLVNDRSWGEPNDHPISVASLDPPFILALSSAAASATFVVAPYPSVATIPPSLSPCDLKTSSISGAALAHFSADPCALLTNGEWEEASGQEPAYSNVLFKAPWGGDCQWEMKNPGPDGNGTNTNFDLGEVEIHEGSWALFESEVKAIPGAKVVHGLGQQAWCSPNGSHSPPTVAEAIFVALNANWSLAINADSCGSATYLGHQAYDRLEAYSA